MKNIGNYCIKKTVIAAIIALLLAFLVHGNAFSVCKNILKDTVNGGKYDRAEKTTAASSWVGQDDREGALFRDVNDYVQTITLRFDEPAVSDTTIQLYSASGENMEALTHLVDITVYPGGMQCQMEIHKYVDNVVVYQTSPYSGKVDDIVPITISEAVTNANYMNPVVYAKVATKSFLLQNGKAPIKNMATTFVLIMMTLFLLKIELPKVSNKKLVLFGVIIVDLALAVWFVLQAMEQAAYPSYRNAILFMGLFAITGITSVFYLAFFRGAQLHKVYGAAGFFMGLLFMILLPVYQVPDEIVHLDAAYELSNRMLGEKIADDGTLYMRVCDEKMEEQTGQFTSEDYERYYGSIWEKADDTEMVKTDREPARTWRYQYFVSSLGITLGRLLGMGPTFSFLLGRFFALLLFVTMTTYAIKKTPVGKMVLFALALMPMTVQQSMSFSYDSLLIPAVFLTVALSLHLVYGGESQVSVVEYVVLTIAGVTCMVAKGHTYLMTAFLPLLVLLHRKTKSKKEIRNAVIVTGICLLFLLLTCKLQPMVFPDLEPKPEGYENYISWADAEGYTISGLLHQPVLLMEIAYHTIVGYTPFYLDTFLGDRLGWLEIYLSDFCLQIVFFGLVLASVPRKENSVTVSRDTSMALWIVGIIEIMFVFGGFLISWTPITETAICGVQGRYFIPVAVPLLMALRGKFAKISNKLDGPLCVVFVLMLCWVAVTVVSRV